MRKLFGIALAVLGFTLALGLAGDGLRAQNSSTLDLLIITGANNHDWKATTPVLREMLEKTGRFRVAVSDDPAAPVLTEDSLCCYQVVLLNYNGPRWEAKREQALVEYVRQGGGLVIVHAANNPFADWKEFNEMIGAGWRAGAGHGKAHAFSVEVTDQEHAITRGMTPQLNHVTDELYHNLTGPMLAENPPAHTRYHLLARAFSNKETGGTGRHEPMAWTADYYQGRVFHTPMGHFPSSMQDDCFRAFLTRGSEWAATAKVTIALPKEVAQSR